MGHGGSAGHTLFRVAAQARKVNRHRVETFQRSVPLETSGVVRHLKSTPPTKPDPCPGPRGSKILFSPEPALLVVEDASDHAALIRVAARCAFPGLDVRVAGDGREGIAYLEGTPPFQDRRSHPFPDLVILDLIMPNIDGFGVLEHARGRHWRAPFPIVVLTALNILGVKTGKSTQNVLTTIKVAGLVAVIFIGLFVTEKNVRQLF